MRYKSVKGKKKEEKRRKKIKLVGESSCKEKKDKVGSAWREKAEEGRES